MEFILYIVLISVTVDYGWGCQGGNCPVDGGWTAWEHPRQFGKCSVTCGTKKGTITKFYDRFCTNPEPAHGGKPCLGGNVKYMEVECTSANSCTPIPGQWGSWKPQTIGPCSVTCGSGTHDVIYKRLCDNPPPMRGALGCRGNWLKTVNKTCDTGVTCKVHGGWSSWTRATSSSCSVTCGSGIVRVKEVRSCNHPIPKNGGRKCPGISTRNVIKDCDKQKACSVDGGWSDWVKKTVKKCSVTCGTGTREISWERICDNPKPVFGGQLCVGNSSTITLGSCDTGLPCIETTVTVSIQDLQTETTENTAERQVSKSSIYIMAGSAAGGCFCIGLMVVGILCLRKQDRNESVNLITSRLSQETKTDGHHRPSDASSPSSITSSTHKTSDHQPQDLHHNPAYTPD